MNEIRTAIVDLLQQMRQLRDCIPDKRYRPLQRQITQVSEQISTACQTYATIRDAINEFCSRNAVDADRVYIDPCSIPVPYEDYDDPGIEISLSREETDQEYLDRLRSIYQAWLQKALTPISASEWTKLFFAINERLYTARNITADETVIRECLDALGSIYHALNHDANGQATVAEQNRFQRASYAKLAAKYL